MSKEIIKREDDDGSIEEILKEESGDDEDKNIKI